MYSLPSTSHALLPLTRSKTTGSPPTDLKARTGEETPPGIKLRASAMSSSDLVVVNCWVATIETTGCSAARWCTTGAEPARKESAAVTLT